MIARDHSKSARASLALAALFAAVLLLACGESEPVSEPAPELARRAPEAAAPPPVSPLETEAPPQPDVYLGELPPEPLPSAKPPIAPPGALEAQAAVQWRGGDKGAALTLLSRAVADRPDSASARSEFGRYLMAVTAFDLAQEHLEMAAELSPDDPQVWLDLVALYENLQDPERVDQARARAEALAAGRDIVMDERGFYTLQ